MDPWVIFSGLLVGSIIGATGMGGGAIMTPLLILGFGVPPAIAVGTDLIFAFVTKLFGTWQHWRQKSIDFSLLKRVALGSIPGTISGIWLLHHILFENSILLNLILSKLLAILFLCTSVIMLIQLYGKDLSVHHQPHPALQLFRLVSIGFLVGFLVAITSVGSGTLFIALLLLIYPFSASKLVGTDLFHGVVIIGLSAIAHYYIGTIDMDLVINLLLGSIPGVLLGSRLTKQLPDKLVRIVIIVMLVLSAIKLY